jgi:hypothetical protein
MGLDLAQFETVREDIRGALRSLGQKCVDDIKESLSVPGQPKPFVAALPGQPSYNWDDELVDGIFYDFQDLGLTMVITVWSAGVSLYSKPGEIIAADAEFGSFWNGWAFDSSSGKWLKVAPPHDVLPRPHMQPELDLMANGLALSWIQNQIGVI